MEKIFNTTPPLISTLVFVLAWTTCVTTEWGKWDPVKHECPSWEYKCYPTVKPADNFNAPEDVKNLKDADLNLDVLIDIVANRSLKQRLAILNEFQQQHQKDLVDVLQKKVPKGRFKDLLLALFKPMSTFLKDDLKNTMHSFSDKIAGVLDIVGPLSNVGIRAVRSSYFDDVERTLENDLEDKANIKGHCLSFFKQLVNGEKTEGDEELSGMVFEDVQKLSDADRFLKTNYSTFQDILLNRSNVHLRSVYKEFFHSQSHSVKDALNERGVLYRDNCLKQAISSIYMITNNRAVYFAERLHTSLKDFWCFVNHDILKRIIVARAEIDLKNIKLAFKYRYKESLAGMIKKASSGEYQKLLLALIENSKNETADEDLRSSETRNVEEESTKNVAASQNNKENNRNKAKTNDQHEENDLQNDNIKETIDLHSNNTREIKSRREENQPKENEPQHHSIREANDLHSNNTREIKSRTEESQPKENEPANQKVRKTVELFSSNGQDTERQQKETEPQYHKVREKVQIFSGNHHDESTSKRPSEGKSAKMSARQTGTRIKEAIDKLTGNIESPNTESSLRTRKRENKGSNERILVRRDPSHTKTKKLVISSGTKSKANKDKSAENANLIDLVENEGRTNKRRIEREIGKVHIRKKFTKDGVVSKVKIEMDPDIEVKNVNITSDIVGSLDKNLSSTSSNESIPIVATFSLESTDAELSQETSSGHKSSKEAHNRDKMKGHISNETSSNLIAETLNQTEASTSKRGGKAKTVINSGTDSSSETPIESTLNSSKRGEKLKAVKNSETDSSTEIPLKLKRNSSKRIGNVKTETNSKTDSSSKISIESKGNTSRRGRKIKKATNSDADSSSETPIKSKRNSSKRGGKPKTVKNSETDSSTEIPLKLKRNSSKRRGNIKTVTTSKTDSSSETSIESKRNTSKSKGKIKKAANSDADSSSEISIESKRKSSKKEGKLKIVTNSETGSSSDIPIESKRKGNVKKDANSKTGSSSETSTESKENSSERGSKVKTVTNSDTDSSSEIIVESKENPSNRAGKIKTITDSETDSKSEKVGKKFKGKKCHHHIHRHHHNHHHYHHSSYETSLEKSSKMFTSGELQESKVKELILKFSKEKEKQDSYDRSRNVEEKNKIKHRMKPVISSDDEYDISSSKKSHIISKESTNHKKGFSKTSIKKRVQSENSSTDTNTLTSSDSSTSKRRIKPQKRKHYKNSNEKRSRHKSKRETLATIDEESSGKSERTKKLIAELNASVMKNISNMGENENQSSRKRKTKKQKEEVHSVDQISQASNDSENIKTNSAPKKSLVQERIAKFSKENLTREISSPNNSNIRKKSKKIINSSSLHSAEPKSDETLKAETSTVPQKSLVQERIAKFSKENLTREENPKSIQNDAGKLPKPTSSSINDTDRAGISSSPKKSVVQKRIAKFSQENSPKEISRNKKPNMRAKTKKRIDSSSSSSAETVSDTPNIPLAPKKKSVVQKRVAKFFPESPTTEYSSNVGSKSTWRSSSLASSTDSESQSVSNSDLVEPLSAPKTSLVQERIEKFSKETVPKEKALEGQTNSISRNKGKSISTPSSSEETLSSSNDTDKVKPTSKAKKSFVQKQIAKFSKENLTRENESKSNLTYPGKYNSRNISRSSAPAAKLTSPSTSRVSLVQKRINKFSKEEIPTGKDSKGRPYSWNEIKKKVEAKHSASAEMASGSSVDTDNESEELSSNKSLETKRLSKFSFKKEHSRRKTSTDKLLASKNSSGEERRAKKIAKERKAHGKNVNKKVTILKDSSNESASEDKHSELRNTMSSRTKPRRKHHHQDKAVESNRSTTTKLRIYTDSNQNSSKRSSQHRKPIKTSSEKANYAEYSGTETIQNDSSVRNTIAMRVKINKKGPQKYYSEEKYPTNVNSGKAKSSNSSRVRDLVGHFSGNMKKDRKMSLRRSKEMVKKKDSETLNSKDNFSCSESSKETECISDSNEIPVYTVTHKVNSKITISSHGVN